MPAWKDATSYSRGDKERVPRIWELKFKSWSITVHRLIYRDPTEWFLSCRDLRIDQMLLKEVDLERAQAEAIEFVAAKLAQMRDDCLKVVKERERARST